MTESNPLLSAKTIAVVGAGPSGVIAAKYLQAERAFEKIMLFEQRSSPGGIWNYTPNQAHEHIFTIPQTNPRGTNQDPIWIDGGRAANLENGCQKELLFVSPMYEKLETNIPRGLMGFQQLDWPKDSQLFPTHESVLQYIKDYGKDVQHLVQYETQVTDIEPTSDAPDTSWHVQTRNLRTEETQRHIFSAVIVANGHFIVPHVPDIPGIQEWITLHPGSIVTHSKYYRQPCNYHKLKVIVVGNSASGADISNQISSHCSLPLLWSSRSASMFAASHGSADPRRRQVPAIKRFTPSNRGVEFENGLIESHVDAVIFATGYFYSLPFLETVKPQLITDGSHVNHTYKHLFFAPQPTLSFLALNQRVIPFPLAEAQAAILARVYAGRLRLPAYEEMCKWEKNVITEMGNGRDFHLLPFPKDAEYINEMSHWALSAPQKEGLENDGKGKPPPIWREWEFWCRENFPAIRRAFGALGRKRHQVRSLEEVGFDFKEDKRKD
ncbi:hypothetical protein GQ44DRAFT_735476 [Phaeosphaeriaceae sp. PMI808]|nr:hypothetical protein GQ44DRAFT_735476 [Phaeosphaeriaceae sp. PMI808]